MGKGRGFERDWYDDNTGGSSAYPRVRVSAGSGRVGTRSAGINRPYLMNDHHPTVAEKQRALNTEIENFVNNFLLGDPKDVNQLIKALLTWIQNFAFRADDEIGAISTYENTEENSMQYLRVFKDTKLHLYFTKGKKDSEYKKAKKYIAAMLRFYSTKDFKQLSYIK